MSTENTNKNTAFWEKYRSVVLSLSIPEARAEWYVKWAQSFARSAAGPLKSRTPEQITAFLNALAAKPRVEKWHISQASEALQVLYRDVLKVSWAIDLPWSDKPFASGSAQPREGTGSAVAPSSKRVSFRDEAVWRNVDALHENVFKRLRTEMRTRHYSIRTERSYEHWVLRFIAFHDLKSPEELTSAAVKEYLEYLAEVR